MIIEWVTKCDYHALYKYCYTWVMMTQVMTETPFRQDLHHLSQPFSGDPQQRKKSFATFQIVTGDENCGKFYYYCLLYI